MKKNLLIDGQNTEIDILSLKQETVAFYLGGKSYQFSIAFQDGTQCILRDEQGRQMSFDIAQLSDRVLVQGALSEVSCAGSEGAKGRSSGGASGHKAPMPGKIFKTLVKVGDQVKKGQTLLILEAMKMEHPIKADSDGVVKKILKSEGELVQAGLSLVELE